MGEGLSHAGIGIRFVAGIIDLIVVAIPFCVFVTFLAVGMNVWNSFFFDYHPGHPLPEDLAQKGPTLIYVSVAFLILSQWLYFALMESSAWRATVGKRLFDLSIADELGNPIGFWQASKRFLGGRFLMHVPTVGVFYFVVDCLCIKLLPQNRALHDRLAGCLVLRDTPVFTQ